MLTEKNEKKYIKIDHFGKTLKKQTNKQASKNRKVIIKWNDKNVIWMMVRYFQNMKLLLKTVNIVDKSLQISGWSTSINNLYINFVANLCCIPFYKKYYNIEHV